MFNAIKYLLMSKDRQLRHLLGKQKEINLLNKRINELEDERKRMVDAMEIVHNTIKETFRAFCWFR
jgi:hypothetical protein